MEFKEIKSMIDSFNARFSALSAFEKEIADAIVMQRNALDETNSKLYKEMEKSVDSYVKTEIEKVRKDIKKLLDSYGKSLKESSVDCNESDISVDGLISLDYDVNRETVKRLCAEINSVVAALNALDMEEVSPVPEIVPAGEKEESFVINSADGKETVTCDNGDDAYSIHGEPYAELLRELYIKASRCNRVLDSMEAAIRRRFDLKKFDKHLKSKAEEYIADCAAVLNKEMASALKGRLRNEDDVLNDGKFSDIYASAKSGKVNFEKGSSSYPTKLTLGDMKISYLDKKDYKKYINSSDSPLLNKYTPDGVLTAPYVLELKKNGNVFIEVEKEEDNLVAIQMVRNIMLSFLMGFPPTKVNYQLIDLYDTGEFAAFNQLNNIDNNIFKKTYNDDSRIATEMVNLDERMSSIYDDKITRNQCKDIYGYNVLSENDPQSFTVLPIIGFPECFSSEKTVKRLKKIIENGNRSGIYTIIVYNPGKGEYPKYVKDFVESAKKSMNYFVVRGGKIYMDGNAKYEFKNNVDSVYAEMPAYINVIKRNIKKGTNKVIALTKMFDNTDVAVKSDDYVDPTEVIDIPIGMRGGEVQTLAFSSKGDGAAHALVIGGTGSGKSNLLHTIVMSACYKYSPDDFNVYLVDFKGGVEFKYYEADKNVSKQLPHVKLTALSSDPEDGLAVLSNIDKELERREALFRNNNVEDIMQYKKRTGKSLPRLLVIIDEVQELFERDQNIGTYAINLMSKLFKKGRAFGINVLWASQNVPKVAGLRDKVISQVGNRISLKLNNPDDAQELGISVSKVANLSNTLGVGIIKDTRTGQNAAEFRVAYAESSDNRGMYSERIIDKWQDVVDKWKVREPLFVVGSNLEEPKANEGLTAYNKKVGKNDVVSKSTESYNLAIGQDYISGRPYTVPIHLRNSGSNLWFAGANVEVLRDMMGFSMLSVLMENRTNKDFEGDESTQVYYFNGEVVSQKNPDDLFFVLPRYFGNSTEVLNSTGDLTDALVKLHNLRKQRAENIQLKHNPVFVFINKIQEIASYFKDNSRLIDLSEKPAPAPVASSTGMGFSLGLNLGGGASSGGNKMTFAQLFNDVFENGPNQNIHIVFSIDKPSSIPSINTAMRNCQNKVFIKGLDAEAITSVASFRSNINIGIEGLGVCLINNDMNKFKPYRYYSDEDQSWMVKLAESYNNLWK